MPVGEDQKAAGTLSRLWDAIAGVPTPAPAGQPSNASGNISPADSEAAQFAEKLFLPTGCMQLLRCVHRALPAHHLIAADFAHFAPSDVKIAGRNAPIISHTVRPSSTYNVVPFVLCFLPVRS